MPVRSLPTLHGEKISKKSYLAYAKAIQEYFPGCFWVLEDYLSHAIDTRAIYVYKEENTILGFASAMLYDTNLAEVFGIAAIKRETYYQIYWDILVFLKIQCERLIVFSGSIEDVEFLLGLGFQCRAKTIFLHKLRRGAER